MFSVFISVVSFVIIVVELIEFVKNIDFDDVNTYIYIYIYSGHTAIK